MVIKNNKTVIIALLLSLYIKYKLMINIKNKKKYKFINILNNKNFKYNNLI